MSSSSSNAELALAARRQQLRKYHEQWRKENWSQLFQDTNFRLLKVDHGETRINKYRKEIISLKVITPASDPTIAEDVKKKGWLCVSHLWGDPSEWIDWDEAGVVDGDTGELIKAKVLPDKRDPIMSLLQHHAGYWWIDIFCSQLDTPLVIMGDIYKYCNRCMTLIDGPQEMFYGELLFAFKTATRLSKRHATEAAYKYLDIIIKTHHENDGSSEWFRLFKNTQQWASNHLEQEADLIVNAWKRKYSKGPRSDRFFNTLLQLPIHRKIDTAQRFFGSKEYNPRDFAIFFSEKSFMNRLQATNPETLIRAQRALTEFVECGWMTRVWTFQELALPWRTAVLGLDTRLHSVSLEIWRKNIGHLLAIMAKAHEARASIIIVGQSKRKRANTLQSPRQLLNYYQRTDPVLGHIYSDYRMLLERGMTVGFTCFHKSDADGNLARRIMLNAFATSNRTALYPEDYVYGVLGILDIDIPRLKDRDKIWPIFSEKLREKYPGIDVPDYVNLANATKLEDVYGEFRFTRENDISHEVVEYLCNGFPM